MLIPITSAQTNMQQIQLKNRLKISENKLRYPLTDLLVDFGNYTQDKLT